LSAQEPPLTHGADEHGVISQFVPEYPVGQVQVYVPSALSAHVPLFKQGVLEHGVISQLVPEYPGGHAHEQVAGGPGLRTFTPPLLHTNGSHGVTSQLVPE